MISIRAQDIFLTNSAVGFLVTGDVKGFNRKYNGIYSCIRETKGHVNVVYRIESIHANWIFKIYNCRYTPTQIHNSCCVRNLVNKTSKYASSIDLRLHVDKDNFTTYYSMSEYSTGEVYEFTDNDQIIEVLARSLGGLHRSLFDLKGISRSVRDNSFITHEANIIDIVARIRNILQVKTFAKDDEVASNLIIRSQILISCKSYILADEYNNNRQIIHGDARIGNCILGFNKRDLIFIDFDQVSYLPRTYELYRCFFSSLERLDSDTIAKLGIYLRAYRSANPIECKEMTSGIIFYLQVLASDLRSFEDEMLYFSTFHNLERLKIQRLLWIQCNLEAIIDFLRSLS